MKGTINTDLEKIWSEIYKPEAYKDKRPQDFFSFEFIMLPHKVFQPELF